MKKLIVTIPLFALLLTLTFCTKENSAVSDAAQQTTTTNPDVAVTDRANCYVRITSDLSVDVCGLTPFSTAPCTNCAGASKFLSSGTYQVFTVDDTVLVNFTLTNNNATAITGYVSLGNGTPGGGTHYCYILQPGESRCFGTLGCGLYTSQAPDC